MKKKIIFTILVVGITISSILIYGKYLSNKQFANISNTDVLMITTITMAFLIYYIKLDSNPQLVTASINTEKTNTENTNNSNKPNVSFKDVAGLEEIKEELQETIDFINNSEKYIKMGATIPKGILFYGPPGTGKTLLAKAVAGETNSSFLYASGSEFVEKYVGVGAKRIRTLFEKAKKDAPCIIFIDEIDAIGSKRNLDSNNEKDQTLNQLLVEMDGFNKSNTIVVIGATNRLDLLDEALLRPGRFDRHMYVGTPNVKAREKIFQVHTCNKPLDESIDIKELAKKTHGLSGAELANIANEAAIIAVRKNKQKINKEDFNAAIERVIAGLEIKHPSVLLKEKKIVSNHEAGHAIVGKILKTDMIQKISIIPRGQALGYVLKFPDEDRYLISENELLNKITVLLAGRAAEQIIFNEITTGAKDDLKKATKIALDMVCDYGMSSFGNIAIDEKYLHYNFHIMEKEVKKITNLCFNRATQIIENNKIILSDVSNYLMENETMDGEQLNEIFKKYESLVDYAI